MRGAFADGARTHLLAVPDALEPDVRAATEEIFEDFTLIDPVMDPPGLVASYLDSIAEPLGRLRELGMQLVAVKTSGSLEVAGNATPGHRPNSSSHPRRAGSDGTAIGLRRSMCLARAATKATASLPRTE